MLGKIRIYINGVESTATNWTTAKARDLLIYLAHCGEPVSKDRILDALWPDLEINKSSHLFHTTLYYLRQVLKQASGREDLIVYSGGSYRLPADGFITDRDRFENLLNTGKTIEEITETAITSLTEAVELHQGDYLADLEYPWLISVWEHLGCLYRQILKRLGHYYLEKQNYEAAINYLRLSAESDPFAEDTSALLMRAYAEIGDLMALKETYQSLADSLEEELGVPPSKEIEELFQKLIGGNRS